MNNNTIADPTTTTGFAWFIANHSDLYMNATIDQIYALNQKNENRGLSVAEVMGTYDIYYNTAMCMHHGTGSNMDGYKVKISNIIEFESPGIITIYNWTGKAGNATISYDSLKFDLSNEATARDFWENKMKLSSSTFNHTKMKTDISAFAYLDYKAIESKEYSGSNSSGISQAENTIYYWWRAMSSECSIRDYVKATGKMDPIYNWALDEARYGWIWK